jgi:hypothetical protein
MSVVLRRNRSFAPSSPVARYWLANCVGFAVSGGLRGSVETVLAEDDPTEPDTLVVRTGRFRLRRVPLDAVLWTVPSERLVVVCGRPGALRVRGAAAARASGRELARLGMLGLVRARRGWAVGAPVAAAWLRRGSRASVRLIRSPAWRSYARFALSATTRLSQELWRRSSPLRTTWSRPSSARRSADEVDTTSST